MAIPGQLSLKHKAAEFPVTYFLGFTAAATGCLYCPFTANSRFYILIPMFDTNIVGNNSALV